MVVPAEYFRFLGYDLNMIASRLMTKQHQGLAGEAIHLPSLAVIMISMLAVVQFPGLWASPGDGCSELDFRLGLLNRIPMQVQERAGEFAGQRRLGGRVLEWVGSSEHRVAACEH